MPQEFKVVSYILPLKVSKKDYHPHEFEKMINDYLEEGWKIINCESIFLSGVSPET